MSKDMENQVTDGLEFLDNIIDELEEATSSGSSESNLNLCFLGDANFTFRPVLDQKGKLSNQWWQYTASIETKDEKGETKKKRVRYRAPGKEDDVLAGISKEMPGYSYKCRFQSAIYGEIISIEKGKSDFMKEGPCILIHNKKFLDALKSSFIYLRKNAPQDLANTFDPRKPGFSFIVESKRGAQGTCKIQVDALGKKHKFKEEFYDSFKDITAEYCPAFGAENDANGQILLEEYKRILREKANYVDPDANDSENQVSDDTSIETPIDEKKPEAEIDADAAFKTSLNKTEVKEVETDADAALEAALNEALQ